jgi:hypothetical protein
MVLDTPILILIGGFVVVVILLGHLMSVSPYDD